MWVVNTNKNKASHGPRILSSFYHSIPFQIFTAYRTQLSGHRTSRLGCKCTHIHIASATVRLNTPAPGPGGVRVRCNTPKQTEGPHAIPPPPWLNPPAPAPFAANPATRRLRCSALRRPDARCPPPNIHRARRPRPRHSRRPRQGESHHTYFISCISAAPRTTAASLLAAIVRSPTFLVSVPRPPPPHLNQSLVDPTKDSGQSLYLQYIGKRGKVVLDAQWVYKCIQAGRLQTYQSNFANCKVNGSERYYPLPISPWLSKTDPAQNG